MVQEAFMNRLPFDKPGPFWRGNLHSHSTRSDGMLTPEALCRVYRDSGYDFLVVSDHLRDDFTLTVTDTSPYRDGRFTTLLGAELHPGRIGTGEPWHLIAVGLPADFSPVAAGESPASVVDRAAASGAFVMMAHPQWYGLTHEDAETISGAHALEIWNATAADANDRPDGWYLLDSLASAGSRILGCAVDDAHAKPTRPDLCRGWVWVRSESREPDGILAALKAGAFYSSTGPRIHDVRVDSGHRVVVECDPAERIFLTGRGSYASFVHGTGVTSADLALDGDSAYGRVTVRDEKGNRAWTNTFWWPD
jgi:hypothetical protein